LKNKSYCIFNKQYSKEAWHKQVAKLIERMREDGQRGEFFPIAWSPLPYNESWAGNQWPLSKEEVDERGYWRRPEEQHSYTGTKYILLPLQQYDPASVGQELASKQQAALFA
jgi:hypothetical protein